MKSQLLALALAATVAASAFAAPTPSLPAGPGTIKFRNLEQIAVPGAGSTTCFQGAFCTGDALKEINWGVLVVSTIEDSNSNITFVDNLLGFGQIVGIFYGARAIDTVAGENPGSSPFPATGGFIDLYYRDNATYGASVVKISDYQSSGPGDGSLLNPYLRTDIDKAGPFTTGHLIAHLEFASGEDPFSSDVFITGTVIPSSSGIAGTGIANSYANVVLGSGGSLEDKLNSDSFSTPYGTRDFKFKNSYVSQASWDDVAKGVVGALSDDPADFRLLPEPGSLALIGIGLLGLAGFRRRKD